MANGRTGSNKPNDVKIPSVQNVIDIVTRAAQLAKREAERKKREEEERKKREAERKAAEAKRKREEAAARAKENTARLMTGTSSQKTVENAIPSPTKPGSSFEIKSKETKPATNPNVKKFMNMSPQERMTMAIRNMAKTAQGTQNKPKTNMSAANEANKKSREASPLAAEEGAKIVSSPLQYLWDKNEADKKTREEAADKEDITKKQEIIDTKNEYLSGYDEERAKLDPALAEENSTKKQAMDALTAEEDEIVQKGKAAADTLTSGSYYPEMEAQLRADVKAYQDLQDKAKAAPVGEQTAQVNADKKAAGAAFDEYAYRMAAVNSVDYAEASAKGHQKDTEVKRATDGSVGTMVANVATGQEDQTAYNLMSADERGAYDYYAEKNPEIARRYLESLNPQLVARAAEMIDQNIENVDNEAGKKVVRFLTTIAGSSKNVQRKFENIPAAFTGSEDVVAPGMIEQGQRRMAQRLEGIEKVVNDVGYNTVNFLPSAAVSMIPVVGPAAAAAMTGVTTYSGTYADTVAQGYTPEEAMRYAIPAAASEALLQRLMGGIAKTGGTNSLASTIERAAGRFAKNPAAAKGLSMLGNMGSEGAEEYIQANIDPILRNVILNEDNEIDPFSEDKFYAAVLGALTSLATNTPMDIAEAARIGSTGKTFNSPEMMQGLASAPGAEEGITVKNNVNTAFGRDDMSQYLGTKNENVIYTKNNEDIGELLSHGRQLPEATRSNDVFVTQNISQGKEGVKYSLGRARAKANAVHEKTGAAHLYNTNDTVSLQDGSEAVVVAHDGDTYVLAQAGAPRYIRKSPAEITGKVDKARPVDKFLAPEKKAYLNERFERIHTEKVASEKFMKDLSEATGVNVEFADLSRGGVRRVNGKYDPSTDTIYFDRTVTRAEALKSLAMHEITHATETSPHHAKYREFALEQLTGGDEARIQNAIQAIKSEYAQAGWRLTDDRAKNELAAMYTAQILYADQTQIDALVAGNRNMATRIYDAIKTAMQKLGAYFRGDTKALAKLNEYQTLERGRRMFEKALKTREPQVDAEAAFAIENIPGTNKQFVKADRQVIEGNNPKEWSQSVENYINQEIRNGKDVNLTAADGDILTITKDTAGKAKFRNSMRLPDGTSRPMTNNEFQAKLRAEAHIDELAQVSTRGKHDVPDYKKHSFAKDGFNYRVAYFEDADGEYYRVTMSVGKNGGINTIYNVGKMQKNTKFPLGAQGPGSKATENFVSDAIINLSEPDVNNKLQYSIEGISDLNGLTDADAPPVKGEYVPKLTDANVPPAVSEYTPKLTDANVPPAQREYVPQVTDGDISAEGVLPTEYENEFKISRAIDGAKEIAKRQIRGKEETPDYSMPGHNDAPGEPIEMTDADKMFAYDEKQLLREQLGRAGEMVDSDYNGPKPKAGEVFKDAGDWFMRKLVDQQHEIGKYGEEMTYRANAVRAATKSADFSIGYTTQKGKKGNSATHQTDLTGTERMGESLADIFEPINSKGKDYVDEFSKYLLHRLNIDRMTIKQRAKEQIPALEAETARIINESPYLADSVVELTDLANANVDGSDEARTVLKLRDQIWTLNNKENKPVFDDTITADASALGISQYEASHPEFKKLAQKIYKYIDNLQKCRIQAGLLSEADAVLMKQLYPNYVPMNMTGYEGAVSYLDGEKTQSVGKTVKRAQGNYGNMIGNLQDAIARQTRQVFRNGKENILARELAQRADKGNSIPNVNYAPQKESNGNTIRFFENGRRAEMEVNDAMMEAFRGFRNMTLDEGTVGKFVSKTMNFYKAAITQYNPMFQGRNFIKDMQDAGFYTKYPKEFFKRYGQAMKEIAGNGKYWQMYQAAGGFSSSLYAEYAEAGTQKSRGKMKKLSDNISNASMFIEQAPRLAEFIATMENGGTIEQALYNAQDITGNFGRAGTWGKALNRYFVPFFNPSVQGFDKFVREIRSAFETGGTVNGKKLAGTLTRGSAKLLLRASLLAIVPSLLNELMLGDDDDYKNQQPYVKEKYYLIKVGDDKFLRIPKGRVTSILGNLAQNTVRSVRGEADAWSEYGKTVIDNIGPANPLTNNLASPVFGVINNRNWWGGAIESQNDQKKAPEDRYDEKTSGIAKVLGQITAKAGVSPKQVDYLLEQYTGVFGDTILPMTTQTGSQNPVETLLRSFSKEYIIDPVMNNKLYDQTNEIETNLNYAINKETKSEIPSVNVLSMRFLNRQNKEINDLNTQIKDINQSAGTGQYERIRALRKQINAANERILENYPKFRDAIEKYYDVDADASEEEQKKATEIAYIKAYRDVMGAEGAIETIGKDAYESAQEANAYGTEYDTYLDYYLNTRALGKDAKKEDRVRVMAEMDVPDGEIAGLYAATMESKDTKEENSIIYAQEMGVRPWAFVQRELQAAGEHGEAGASKEDMIYENGQIVYDEKGQTVSGSKKRQTCVNILSSGYTDKEKIYFYQKQYGSDDNFARAMQAEIPPDAYLSIQTRKFEGEKDANGKTVTNSVKNEYIDYVNGLKIDDGQKLFLVAQKYKVSGSEATAVRGYVDGLNISDEEKQKMLESLKLSGGGGSGRRRSGRRSGKKIASPVAKIPDSAWASALATMGKGKAPELPQMQDFMKNLMSGFEGIGKQTLQQQFDDIDANPLYTASMKTAKKAEAKKRFEERR